MDVVCYEVTFRINDKTAVFQEWRRDVYLDILAEEPALHLLIAPTVLGVDSRQTLDNHLHTVREFIHAGQTALILLTHHDALVLTQRILAQPKGHQRDA